MKNKSFLWVGICALALSFSAAKIPACQIEETRVDRHLFQTQEVIPAKFGGWVFQVGSTPRLIWRDVDEVRRLGRDAAFDVRWFDSELNESPEPNAAGRWLASIQGFAPNGTPMRRAFTFFALPTKIDNNFVPDLTFEFTNFPGPNAPSSWKEFKPEFDRISRDILNRSLIDSEKGAILIAGIAESVPVGRPRIPIESTSVVNDDFHLALKLKLMKATVRTLQPHRLRESPATMLHDGAPADAGVPIDAKTKIDDFCRDWAKATNEPFVTLIARRGVIITHQAFGNDESDVPITQDYRCWVASITKTVTSIMFSQFVDQHLIELDSPISSVFSDYPLNDSHVPTFRQCLNHTSGLSGHSDFGGMKNPHLENVILNGIDVNEPGKAYAYSGMGFELVAKAMEIASGKSAARVFHEHLFQPLGFGDAALGNASSDGEFTAMELGILGQWVANEGSYGNKEFINPATFSELLPKPLEIPGATEEQGLGLHWVRHRKPGSAKDSMRPEDQLYGTHTVGHGSFSGCIFVVDLDQKLVIVQVRKKYSSKDDDWYYRFFQMVAEAIDSK